MFPRTDFPPVRACIFDMDGLLLDSEDKITLCTNQILQKYGKQEVPWSIRAQLQGRTAPAAGIIFHEWAQLPITPEQYMNELTALQEIHFPTTQPLPGVTTLLANLSKAHVNILTHPNIQLSKLHLALATSSALPKFNLKTSHLTDFFSVFPSHRKVLGDDIRIPKGKGKPAPDIYLLALKTINDSLEEGEREVLPEECLVFEDSVPGIEAGRRAGMRVVWVPDEGLAGEYDGREGDVLAGRTGEGGMVGMDLVGEVGDGWGEKMVSLVEFPYEKFGIVI